MSSVKNTALGFRVHFLRLIRSINVSSIVARWLRMTDDLSDDSSATLIAPPRLRILPYRGTSAYILAEGLRAP